MESTRKPLASGLASKKGLGLRGFRGGFGSRGFRGFTGFRGFRGSWGVSVWGVQGF